MLFFLFYQIKVNKSLQFLNYQNLQPAPLLNKTYYIYLLTNSHGFE